MCSVPGCPSTDIEAAHFDGPIPNEDRGGMGVKDGDWWTWPGCRFHHAQYHSLGWKAFEALYKIDTKAIAERLAAHSPHRKKWMEQHHVRDFV